MEFLSKKCRLENPRSRRADARSPLAIWHKDKMRPVTPGVGALRGSTAPNALEKVCRRALRIRRRRWLPTASRGKRVRHLASYGRHGEHRCVRLLGAFHGERRITLNAELANRAIRHPSGIRSLLQLPPLATPPLAVGALAAATFATARLVRGSSSSRRPHASDHCAAPRGRQNDPQSRDECQNSTQPKHRCSILQIGRTHKWIFRSRNALADAGKPRRAVLGQIHRPFANVVGDATSDSTNGSSRAIC
jgi:hypothetical protein